VEDWCVVFCGSIVEHPGNVVTVMAVAEESSLAHINPTARKALYNHGNDKPVAVNGKQSCILLQL